MLVLSRKQNDSIFIGPDIEVTVLSVAGGRVKLGIQAPKSVPVIRSEMTRKCELPDAARIARDHANECQRRRTENCGAELPA